LIMNSR